MNTTNNLLNHGKIIYPHIENYRKILFLHYRRFDSSSPVQWSIPEENINAILLLHSIFYFLKSKIYDPVRPAQRRYVEVFKCKMAILCLKLVIYIIKVSGQLCQHTPEILPLGG